MDFKNQTVMVTGAGGNLGRAVAKAFAERGARLVLADLRRDSLERAFGVENEQRLFMPINLLDQHEVDAGVQSAIERYQKIDVLCNLAGDWNFLFDINARSMLHAVRAVTPRMIGQSGGKIVNVGAYSALKGVARMAAYCAAKDVVIRLTEAMAAELRDNNINVNCVLPSIIDTPENRASMPDADPARWVAPEALADAIVFLASDAARAIHGAALPVTGRS
jgi:NAD(P)-dependent dehydrogenase (short-subunit alcohol dehydrogenase family)